MSDLPATGVHTCFEPSPPCRCVGDVARDRGGVPRQPGRVQDAQEDVRFVNELPKNCSGEILKGELRDPFGDS